MKKETKNEIIDYIRVYGWAILIIVVVIFALWQMGVFDNPKEDFAGGCEMLCRNAKLQYKGFSDDRTADGLGCVVCDCYKDVKRIPMVCTD